MFPIRFHIARQSILNGTKSQKYFHDKNGFKEVWVGLIVCLFCNTSVTTNGSKLVTALETYVRLNYKQEFRSRLTENTLRLNFQDQSMNDA
jgi:hypothetical protein